MAGLGPRVGGAHVDVNLKFDDKSLSQVGKQIQSQLKDLNKNMVRQLTNVGDQTKQVYRAIGKDAVIAWRSLLGTIVTSAPLIGSAISAVAGGATLLAGALYSSAQASFAAAPLLAAIGIAAGTAAIGFNGFFAAIKSGDMAGLAPSAAAAAKAVRGLGDEWSRVRLTVQGKMFAGLSGEISKLGTTLLPVLQRGLGKMAEALNEVFRSLLRYTNSAAGLKQISDLLDNSADIFRRLGKAAVPFLDGTLRLFNALAPAGKRLADRIADVAAKFQEWSSAPGFAQRIDTMMKRAEKTAGLLFKVLGNLGSAISNVFNAANPATNTFLQMLVDLTQRFEDWTASVGGQDAIAKWAEQSVVVLAQFGRTAGAVFDVIARLADPRVITSFLKTVEGAFVILGQLPLEAMVDAFVSITEALQPVSSMFLAIIIAGASLNIIIGSLIGQLGGFVAVLAKIVKFKIIMNLLRGTAGGASAAGTAAGAAAGKTSLLARAWGGLVKIFTKIKSLFSSVIGFFTGTSKATGEVATKASRLSGAFKPVLGILGRLAKFAGPVGLAVWIGSIIAKSDDLKEKLGEVWGAMKEAGSALVGAFKEIGTALAPLAPVASGAGKAFGAVFGILDKIAGLAIGVVLDAITYAFKSLANVFKGAGKIIAGVINILVGLFTLDFGKMWDGLKQLVSGIGPLLQGVFGLFISFFAPARLLKIGVGAIKGLASGIASAIPGILAAIGGFLVRVLTFFATLTPRLLVMGGQAFMSLVGAVVRAIPFVLSAVGRLVMGVIGWIARLPGRLLSLGGQAIGGLAGAVARGVPRLLSLASRIFTGVAGWIARLPGRLLSLGVQAIARLAGAVSAGIGRLAGIAGRIFRGIVSALTMLPGRLLSIGQNAISRLAGAVSNGIGRLRGVAGNIKSAVVNALTGLPGQLLEIGRNMIAKLADGILAGLGKVKAAAGKVAGAVGKFFPGSPVQDGPLTKWNHGSDASGGGRNLIDAITAGLQDTNPIRKAMAGVASAVSDSIPTVGAPALAGGSYGSRGGTSYGNISVTISVDDIAKMRRIEDFLSMLDNSRVNARKTQRSGTVTA